MYAITKLAASLAVASTVPDPYEVPALPPGPAACTTNCSIATGGVCHPTLAAAIGTATGEGIIEVRDNTEVNSEITFGKVIAIKGCNGRPTISTNINYGEGGCMFRAIGDGNQKVTLANLIFTNGGGGLATVLRTPELGTGEWPTEPTTGPIAVSIENSDFTGFRTSARGGSVIFIGKARQVNIAGSKFEKNVVEKNFMRWEGGGAVWVRRLEGNSMVWGNTFNDNIHYYEHGYGAALYYEHALSKTKIVGNTFARNSAAGGGALFINNLGNGPDDEVTIDSKFHDNVAPEYTWGSRGGAMWLHDINCRLRLRGEYIGNTAPLGRGGVIAANLVGPGANIEISGTFKNNVAAIGGWLFDARGDVGFAPGAVMYVIGGSVMEGNVGNGTAENKMVVYSGANNVNYTSFRQSTWTGRTVTFTAKTG